MEKGFVQQNHVFYPVRWRPIPKESVVLFHSNKGSIKLTSAFSSGQMLMHHCATCRKFIIDQDALEV